MKYAVKHIIFCLLLLTVSSGYAQKKTFTRDYTYQAGEMDSKISSRTNATAEMRSILLREVGTLIRFEQQTTVKGNEQDYAEKIEAITAGIVEMTVLEERWNGVSYYIKAEMTVDPNDVNKRIAEVLGDKQKTKELEEARKKITLSPCEDIVSTDEFISGVAENNGKDMQTAKRMALSNALAIIASKVMVHVRASDYIDYSQGSLQTLSLSTSEMSIPSYQVICEIYTRSADGTYNCHLAIEVDKKEVQNTSPPLKKVRKGKSVYIESYERIFDKENVIFIDKIKSVLIDHTYLITDDVLKADFLLSLIVDIETSDYSLVSVQIEDVNSKTIFVYMYRFKEGESPQNMMPIVEKVILDEIVN